MSAVRITADALLALNHDPDGMLMCHAGLEGWVTSGHWAVLPSQEVEAHVRWKNEDPPTGLLKTYRDALAATRHRLERAPDLDVLLRWETCKQCNGTGVDRYDLEDDDEWVMDECESCDRGRLRVEPARVAYRSADGTVSAVDPRYEALLQGEVYRLEQAHTKRSWQPLGAFVDGELVAIVMPVNWGTP